jgi:hypothetical protein
MQETVTALQSAQAAGTVSAFLHAFQRAIDKASAKDASMAKTWRDAYSAGNDALKNILEHHYPPLHITNETEHVRFRQHTFAKKHNVKCIASDLLLLRPCIEHYVLAVILGRGGGSEELGATFWGQTELSCYDDSQHVQSPKTLTDGIGRLGPTTCAALTQGSPPCCGHPHGSSAAD